MRLLVLGGTRFLGSAVVDAALADGHAVTVFNRGRSGAPPADVELLLGDRETPEGLSALDSADWDAVIDTSGFVPAVVGRSARALRDRVRSYVFVSTVSAYRDWPAHQVDEDSPTWSSAPDAADDTRDYGELKAGCERAVLQELGDAGCIVRPGFIIGPRDDNGRLPWWLTRVAAGGVVPAPGDPERPIRLVDVRDIAAWLVRLCAAPSPGPFLATGPADVSTMGGLLQACRAVTGSSASLRWFADEDLLAAGVEPMAHLPYWDPSPGLWKTATDRAEQAGLRCRPLVESVQDTWAWLTAAGGFTVKEGLPSPGLPVDIEARLLAGSDAPAGR
jgi:2'-hydroxyisoflavone reductase